MSQYFEVHPDNPQPRLVRQAVQILDAGGVAAVPTDSSYALVCHLDDKAAAEALRRIRGVDDRHHGVCRLDEEERRLATGEAHLAGVLGIVAADAIDAVDGESRAPGTDDWHRGRRRDGQDVGHRGALRLGWDGSHA